MQPPKRLRVLPDPPELPCEEDLILIEQRLAKLSQPLGSELLCSDHLPDFFEVTVKAYVG